MKLNSLINLTSLFIAASTGENPWYKTVWFLALCALAFVLLVFLIIVCCCRGYRRGRTVYVRQREPLPGKGGWRMGPRSAVDLNDNNGGFPANMRISPIKRPIVYESVSVFHFNRCFVSSTMTVSKERSFF